MLFKDNIKLKKLNFRKSRKSLFIFYGILNALITNLLLQISLLFCPIILATLFSQIFNLNFGFYLYGKKVFEVKSLRKRYYFKYLIISLFLWIVNWICISYLNSYNISRNLSALIVIPFLALISFMYQKYFIFVE
jgi:hypothetical protein